MEKALEARAKARGVDLPGSDLVAATPPLPARIESLREKYTVSPWQHDATTEARSWGNVEERGPHRPITPSGGVWQGLSRYDAAVGDCLLAVLQAP